jgi:diaminopimelate decarboxylase
VNPRTRQRLAHAARTMTTPIYVYFADGIAAQVERVSAAFGGRFELSYAIKANPNVCLLGRMRDVLSHLDASSVGEIERALLAGYSAEQISFSGPGKRKFELERALHLKCGEFVCESERELDTLNSIALHAHQRATVLVRVNLRKRPAGFGAHMGGRASQFGIDEEAIDPVLERFATWPALDLAGFHAYSGSNSLNADSIAENIGNAFEAFETLSDRHDLVPRRLIVGAGFGIPYSEDQEQLDLDRVARLVNPLLDRTCRSSRLGRASLVLELGRYLVGPFGYLLTSVVDVKTSRGTSFAVCDAGFNNHLAAFGLMGSIVRRNWPIFNVTGPEGSATATYTLVGPLCTNIDTLATKVELPVLECGDVIAVASSGAYGLSASPLGFISHPEPREALVLDCAEAMSVIDVSERLRISPFVEQTIDNGTEWHLRGD